MDLFPVGTNLIQLLKTSKNNEICSIDNYSIGSKKNHIEGVEYLEDDIINIQNYHNNFDVIYHLAALSRIQPSFSDPNLIFDAGLTHDPFINYNDNVTGNCHVFSNVSSPPWANFQV